MQASPKTCDRELGVRKVRPKGEDRPKLIQISRKPRPPIFEQQSCSRNGLDL